MKVRFKIGLSLFALAITKSILAPSECIGQGSAVDELRREYHQQGFKTDLSDFDFKVPKELSERAGALTNKVSANMLQPLTFLDNEDLMTPVGDNSLCIVIWKQEALAYPFGFRGYSYLHEPGTDKDVWPAQRGVVEDTREKLDAAVAAVLSGPYGFNLNESRGIAMLLPHLANLKDFTRMIAGRSVLDLHDDEASGAWTNLLAATRIVTAWQIEPVEISQYVRFDCLETVYDVTWQALQFSNWRDAQLAQLQHEWESLDVLKPLTDTVAFQGASYVAALHQGEVPTSDENEKALLLFYHDRELAMRRAVQSQSWTQIQLIPDVTTVFFTLPTATNLPQNVATRMRLNQLPISTSSRGIGLAGRAAEAETRRRLIITAIAVERYRLKHGSYPKSLDALAPDFVKTVPTDFMNGQPLHYSVNRDSHFLLYSVGLNGKDDGGKLSPVSDAVPARARFTNDPDIVWPIPASKAMATEHAAAEGKRIEAELAAIKKRGEDQEAEEEASRHVAVRELLSNPKYKKTTWTGDLDSEGGEILFRNQPLAKLLRNEKATGTNLFSLDELLTLKEVSSSRGFELVVYELPISYDYLSSIHASLDLIMDSTPGDYSLREAELTGWQRATNGDCLLEWSPVTGRAGQHALQACLTIQTSVDREACIKGPVLPYLSTNLVRFSAHLSQFDDRGADLIARVAESNATFSIEIKTESGAHLKTISGTTSNGLIRVEWNLIDDKGIKFTNNSFVSDFHVTLPTGRSQSMSHVQVRVGTRGD